MNHEHLKEQVKDYWNQASCGTELTQQQKFSHAYFEEIEQQRYTIEPEIFAFAQFTRLQGKKVLEVGVGAGTDFVQWVRAGAHAHGIDLTQEALDNVKARLDVYNLKAADLRVADAEHLQYPNSYFDCVYSWGVIHHSPDMEQCLREIIRVTKPGGTIKLMVYNRHSLFAFYRYLLAGLFKGKPFQTISTILFHHQESPGTKAYTRKEIKKMLARYAVDTVQLKATVTQHDLLYYKTRPFRWLAYVAACLCGMNKVGWFMTIELRKQEVSL
jgi:ubiquinone/menaquinone biosynthesis C-methylase UbiE